LTGLGFLMADNPRQTVTRLRRLYNRVRLDQMELGILRGMLTSVQNHLFHSHNRVTALEHKIQTLEARDDCVTPGDGTSTPNT